jgi:hypothetical protein
MKLYALNRGFGFVPSEKTGMVEIVSVEKGWEDKGFITNKTPRVIVHSDMTDEKSRSVVNVHVEFTHWVFPVRHFLLSDDRETVSVNLTHYKFDGNPYKNCTTFEQVFFPFDKVELGSL